MSKVGIQLRGTGAVRTGLRGGGIAKRGTGQALKSGGRTGKFGGGRTNLLEELGRVEAEPSNRNRRAEISRVHGELNRGYSKGGKVFTVTETKKGKPHWTQEGQDASIKRKFQRKSDAHQQGLKPKREDKAEGGRIGLRTGSRGPSAGQRIKARKARSEEWWTGKKGKHQAIYSPSLDTKLREKRPHSTPEGRWGDIMAARAKSKEGGRIGLQSGGPHPENVKKWISRPGKRRKMSKPPKAGGPTHINPKWREGAQEGGRIGLKKGGNGKWMQKVSASIKKRGTKGKCTPITKPGCTGRAKALAKTFKKIAAKRKKS